MWSKLLPYAFLTISVNLLPINDHDILFYHKPFHVTLLHGIQIFSGAITLNSFFPDEGKEIIFPWAKGEEISICGARISIERLLNEPPERKNYTLKTHSCPRDYRISGANSGPLKPPDHQNTLSYWGCLILVPNYAEKSQALAQPMGFFPVLDEPQRTLINIVYGRMNIIYKYLFYYQLFILYYIYFIIFIIFAAIFITLYLFYNIYYIISYFGATA